MPAYMKEILIPMVTVLVTVGTVTTRMVNSYADFKVQQQEIQRKVADLSRGQDAILRKLEEVGKRNK